MRLIHVVAAVTAITAAGAVVERRIAAPRYRGPVTDHFDGTRFYNSHNDGGRLRDQEQASFLKWHLTRQRGYWPEWIDAPPGPPPPRRVDGGRLRVTLVNHATLLLQLDGVNILTDPIWSERCSPVSFAGPRRHRPPAIRFEDLPAIHAVLVSHNHYDHFDVPTLKRLAAAHRPLFVVPLGNAPLLRRHGIARVAEGDWWTTVRITDAVHATIVPSQHFCARAISDRNRTLWGGFVVSSPAGKVYFAGDTGWGTHFDRIAERLGPIRLAMLPIGAYLPRWFMQPVHIDPGQAIEAHLRLGAEVSVPMHYGTFHLGDDGEAQPLDELRLEIRRKRVAGIEILEHGAGREW